MKLGTDVGQGSLGHCICSSLSYKCLVGLRPDLCAGHLTSFISILSYHVFMELALCIRVLSHWNMFGLLVPVKGILNATRYKDIVDNCVLPTLRQQFGEEPHMGVMISCPQTFVHIV